MTSVLIILDILYFQHRLFFRVNSYKCSTFYYFELALIHEHIFLVKAVVECDSAVTAVLLLYFETDNF